MTNSTVINLNTIKTAILFILLAFLISSCGTTPGDAKKIPPNPRDRAAKNIEEGRGFRLMDTAKNLR